jgi:hypothetical protein
LTTASGGTLTGASLVFAATRLTLSGVPAITPADAVQALGAGGEYDLTI